MSSPAVLARPGPRTPERRPHGVASIVVLAIGVVMIAWLSTLLADPQRVDLVVENPTEYHVNVSIRAADGNRVGLGVVRAGTSKPFTEVLDMGSRWRFDYSSGGISAPATEISRDVLQSGPVVITEAVGSEFRAAGLRPPPS